MASLKTPLSGRSWRSGAESPYSANPYSASYSAKRMRQRYAASPGSVLAGGVSAGDGGPYPAGFAASLLETGFKSMGLEDQDCCTLAPREFDITSQHRGYFGPSGWVLVTFPRVARRRQRLGDGSGQQRYEEEGEGEDLSVTGSIYRRGTDERNGQEKQRTLDLNRT